MRYLLEKAQESLTAAERTLAAENYKEARYRYLRAAEYLFRAAAKSEGALKASRLEAAWRLRELVETLDRQEEAKKKHREIRRGQEPSGDRGNDSKRASTTDEGETDPRQWRRENQTGVTFKDVAGLEDVKREVTLNFIYPARYPEEARKYGVALGGGLLLYGAPGTGKTLIARAIAGEVEAPLYVVSPADVMSKWVGEAEQRVKALFAEARSQPRSVIFIDEVESLMPRRKGNMSTVMARVIPQFLSELDGFDKGESTLLFVAATNEPWSLDPAALRPGRFDTIVHVPLPDNRARRRIFDIHLHGLTLSDDIDLDELAEMTAGMSGADLRRVCTTVGRAPFEEKIHGAGEREIERIDFLRTLEQMGPSVSAKQVEQYRRFEGERRKSA
ncbi:MAG: AAA family ATPase [Candidatus Eisenbacteria sp.]|nr:AAA family ATPase [Candidatus Eisenbacteria bacterium]